MNKIDKLIKHLTRKNKRSHGSRNDLQAWKRLKELAPNEEKSLNAYLFFKYETI